MQHKSHSCESIRIKKSKNEHILIDNQPSYLYSCSTNTINQKEGEEVIWVEFQKDDPENPFNFSKHRKWLTTILMAATAGAYVPGITISLLGVSIYALGFGITPLILAPFSEVFGLFFVGTGLVNNMTGMLILRFLQGGFGSTGSTMVGGTIADIWATSERGLPMSLFSVGAIFGTGFGPFWAGFVAGNPKLEWRWIQYIQAIYTGAIFIILLIFLKETRAIRLRKETGDKRFRAKAEEERASIPILIKNSLTRPAWMLFSEPIVFVFSLWISFCWGMMYCLLESIGFITELHNYTPDQTGLVFLTICAGALIGFACNFYQDRLYLKNFEKRGPEARLYAACAAAILFPIGCFIYAWTSYPDVSIAGPVVGITALMTAVYTIYLAVFNYLADAYLVYASSALAAQSFARNMFGFAFPLFVTPMYHNLGYTWAILGVVPFILFFYGHKIRAKSKFSLELQRLHEEQQKRLNQQK
ncbi:MFS general substrate transporter [Meira miltonrushii]|uniref:MFS general substrate transporter n=1 Tax=Meira miltonrushii TaxID=1280837 RepID=A0A316VJR4_9BASI|nr:MFS general substrate transporter [Meira miltonrushii]PWN37832.1 MFS general substrate transporter [Meira miltonrushii]